MAVSKRLVRRTDRYLCSAAAGSTNEDRPIDSMPAEEKRVVLAVDLGGTHLRAALIDDTGQILSQVKYETPKDASSDDVIRALVEAERECRADATILAASVMVPGTVD